MRHLHISFFFLTFFFLTSSLFAENNITIISQIRNKSRVLNDSSIGAIDADGKYTINSNSGLNCSGYIKWIADGFYMPIRKKRGETPLFMSIQELRVKHPECRGDRYTNIFEESRDPYFGLDWTRNIAVKLATLQNNREYSNEYFDVRDSKILDYVEDRGYPLENIKEVIIEQSKTFANRWYLGSISGPFGDNPRLHQHYHVCAFIPFIDEDGKISVTVFERNKETSFDYLEKRYPGTYCHLVWLSTEGEFELMDP